MNLSFPHRHSDYETTLLNSTKLRTSRERLVSTRPMHIFLRRSLDSSLHSLHFLLPRWANSPSSTSAETSSRHACSRTDKELSHPCASIYHLLDEFQLNLLQTPGSTQYTVHSSAVRRTGPDSDNPRTNKQHSASGQPIPSSIPIRSSLRIHTSFTRDSRQASRLRQGT